MQAIHYFSILGIQKNAGKSLERYVTSALLAIGWMYRMCKESLPLNLQSVQVLDNKI